MICRVGFPRADIDVWLIRHTRVRIIELRNDVSALTEEISGQLNLVYDPSLASTQSNKRGPEEAFAKIDSVASGSPAATAVCLIYQYPDRRNAN